MKKATSSDGPGVVVDADRHLVGDRETATERRDLDHQEVVAGGGEVGAVQHVGRERRPRDVVIGPPELVLNPHWRVTVPPPECVSLAVPPVHVVQTLAGPAIEASTAPIDGVTVSVPAPK